MDKHPDITVERLQALGAFAVVGLGSAPGEPDSPALQTDRALRAGAYLAHKGIPCAGGTGSYQGSPEPCVILQGPLAHGAALTLGRALGQESVLWVGSNGVARLAYSDGRPVRWLGTVRPGRADSGDYTESPALGGAFHVRAD